MRSVKGQHVPTNPGTKVRSHSYTLYYIQACSFSRGIGDSFDKDDLVSNPQCDEHARIHSTGNHSVGQRMLSGPNQSLHMESARERMFIRRGVHFYGPVAPKWCNDIPVMTRLCELLNPELWVQRLRAEKHLFVHTRKPQRGDSGLHPGSDNCLLNFHSQKQ
jgi:hypothetical protein